MTIAAAIQSGRCQQRLYPGNDVGVVPVLFVNDAGGAGSVKQANNAFRMAVVYLDQQNPQAPGNLHAIVTGQCHDTHFNIDRMLEPIRPHITAAARSRGAPARAVAAAAVLSRIR